MGPGPDQRAAARERTEPSGSCSPWRSQPRHSHMGHEVNLAGEPASVMLTARVSADPQLGQEVEVREIGAIAQLSSA
jgi:hypothetical protein